MELGDTIYEEPRYFNDAAIRLSAALGAHCAPGDRGVLFTMDAEHPAQATLLDAAGRGLVVILHVPEDPARDEVAIIGWHAFGAFIPPPLPADEDEKDEGHVEEEGATAHGDLVDTTTA